MRHLSDHGPVNAIEGTPAMSHRSGPAPTPPRPPTPPHIASITLFKWCSLQRQPAAIGESKKGPMTINHTDSWGRFLAADRE